MQNILYYVKRFGNHSFKEMPFNEVDGLILSQLIYLNLDSVLPAIDDTQEDISLLEQLREPTIIEACKDTIDRKRNRKLIHALQKSTRYNGLKTNYFSNQFSVEKTLQFCATTFIFDEFMFVAYRGTDITLLGWKENFTMSFLDVIPSQKEAVRYLERVAAKRELPIYIGGHSKGGNLAVFSTLYCSLEVQDRILHIYNYDGPGFQTDIFQTEEFKRISSKISKYSCHQAMVGMLLYHKEPITFINSKGISIFQHDTYNWPITKDGKFKNIKNPNLFSKTFEKTVGDFIENSGIEERKQFLDILFKVGMEHSYSTVLDWVRYPIRAMIGMKKRYRSLNQKERQFFKFMLKKYQSIWKHNFKLFLHQKLEGEKQNEK